MEDDDGKKMEVEEVEDATSPSVTIFGAAWLPDSEISQTHKLQTDS